LHNFFKSVPPRIQPIPTVRFLNSGLDA
jgi:hypothetical protein